MSDYPYSNIVVGTDNIQFKESYKLSKFKFCENFKKLREDYPDHIVLVNRSNMSLALELATHDACYWLHIARERTKDTDSQYPLEWWEKLLYWTIGWICLIFVP